MMNKFLRVLGPRINNRQLLLKLIQRNESGSSSNSGSSGGQKAASTAAAGFESNFGFEQVDPKDKQTKVNEVFTNVAAKYDLMNDAMSFGMHRLWKDTFIREIAPTPGMKIVDVASGTGDLAFRFLHYMNRSGRAGQIEPITVYDINEEMLNVGRQRALSSNQQEQIVWKVGNAEELKLEPDNTYDVYTISFGIRNCTNLDKVVSEAYRILKPGGRFLCLEFSQVNNELFRAIYDTYSFQVIPPMGYLLAGDWKSYQYLVESIRVFPNQDEFAELIRECGFKFVNYKNLTNGIVAIHSGYKF